LPFLKGKKIEVLIIVEDDTDEMIAEEETDYILQIDELMRQIALSRQTYQQNCREKV
jgi:ribosomal protein L1